jgi:hypothetical protein
MNNPGYRERTGRRPERCVLFFVNEPPNRPEHLLAIPLEDKLLDAALAWTVERVKELRHTMRRFRADPCSVVGGEADGKGGYTVSEILKARCTGCGQRFGCETYISSLKGGSANLDVNPLNVFTN